MRTVQFEVKDDIARKIEGLSAGEKDELIRIIDLWLFDRRTLREIMDDISVYAQRQGLSPEILDELLKEE